MNSNKSDQSRDPPLAGGEEIIILSASAGGGGGGHHGSAAAGAKTHNPESPDFFFKTRLCQNYLTRGYCQYNNCSFAHGVQELRNKHGDLTENGARVCKMYYRTGNCTYGTGCSYLHVESGNNNGDGTMMHNNGGSERKSAYKVKPCFSWRSSGKCSYGAYCIFVHGHEDLRKNERITESERGRNLQVPEDSGRSSRSNIFTRPMLNQRSIQKSGSQKLQEMKKIIDIYGDWPY
ncbi:hypothetical protein LUZ60_012137 [Juncus effusus]|nr:hypothetical protein LUZ60_012137 [Juncus effusus]